LGKQFILADDIFYRVSSIEITLDGYKFGIQYEDDWYGLDVVLLIVITSLIHRVSYSDVIDFDEMKRMLQDSDVVEV